MDLKTFLLARIAEDEVAARAVIAKAAPDEWENPTSWGNFYAEEIAFWDRATPARVLAECAAKRAIVEQHPRDDDGFCYDSTTHMRGCQWAYPCPTIRALAAVYADHPAYQPEWAQEGSK